MNEKVKLEDVSPPSDDAFTFLPEKGSDEWQRARAAGLEAVEKNRAAFLVLNGGMATRFSGVVKGVDVDVLGRSFLQWKLRQVRSLSPRTPVFVMNSPFTSLRTIAHLEEHGWLGGGVYCFDQSVYPRERPDGGEFRDGEGKPSMAGRGHGDMLASFAASGMLEKLGEHGCGMLMASNVDNLGAMLDPVLLGLHILGGRSVTVEAARRRPSHKGGVIASVSGKAQVLEGFRWPEGFDVEGYKYFNTNTFYFDREVLESPPDLPLHRVTKEVQGESVIQREKILGEITGILDARFLVVPDEGEESRFLPVKTPRELEASLEGIRSVLHRWNLV